jgi:hypothetical protein
MEIIIDKRIELITIIQTLCNYWDNLSLNFTKKYLFKCKYKDNVMEYFKKYKTHGIIRLYDRLSNNVMDISAFINMILCHSNLPKLTCIANYENNVGKLFGKKSLYKEFTNGLRQFYFETEFDYFFENNQNEYTKIIGDYGNKDEIIKYKEQVINYLETDMKNFTIIVSVLIMGNFGIKISTNEEKVLNYSVLSPYDYKDGKYVFGPENMIKEYLWHEISHLTINDLTKGYINQFSTRGGTISEKLIRNFYNNIETIVNEYIVRSITIRLFELIGENEFVEYLINDNIKKGFENIKSIKEYIRKNCEQNDRLVKDNKYKDLIKYVLSKI